MSEDLHQLEHYLINIFCKSMHPCQLGKVQISQQAMEIPIDFD